MAQKRRKNLLGRAKGYRGVRSKKERYAHEAVMRAGRYAFAHRRDKKNDFRQLWIVRLNAAVRENLPAPERGRQTAFKSYSTFMAALKKKNIALDRKVLAEFAAEHPAVFTRVARHVSAQGIAKQIA